MLSIHLKSGFSSSGLSFKIFVIPGFPSGVTQENFPEQVYTVNHMLETVWASRKKY